MTEILGDLSRLAVAAPLVVGPFMVIFTRLSLLVFLMPGLGMQVVPVRVRLMLSLAVTFLMFPLVEVPVTASLSALIAALAGEAAVGFLLGALSRLFLHALSITGAILAQSLSLSQIFGASIVEEANTTVSSLLTLTGATVFLTLDLHVALLGVLIGTFEAMPAGQVFAGDWTALATEEMIRAASSAFALALSLSLPFLLLNFAYNLILGLMNRAMPQLMVTFVGMPAITLGGLALLTVLSVTMIGIWRDSVVSFIADIAL